MKHLSINFFLALIWASLLGEITPGTLTIGFVAGYFLLWWFSPLLGSTTYFKKVPQTISFILYFLVDIIHSNLRVAREVVWFRGVRQPGIVAVPLDVKSNLEISLLVNLITLTPGTLGVDVSDDRKVLFVHSMFVTSADDTREAVKNGYERRVLELFK